MRILIVLNSYEEDGPGLLVFRLCQRWAGVQNLHVSTVALSRGGPLEGRLRAQGIPAEVVPTRGRWGLLRLDRWLERRMSGPSRPDVIHTHLLWPDLALRLLHRNLEGVPLVSTCHGLHARDEMGRLYGTIYRALDRATRRHCAAWAAVSEATRTAMVEAGYPAERVHLVRNGVDCVQMFPSPNHKQRELRAIMGVEEGAPLIGAVGNLRWIKGHDLLLRAMPAIVKAHPSARLFIIGEGPERENLLALAESLGVQRSVTLIGHLSVIINRISSTCDVIVHPSRVESFGLAPAEAQACGTPVVATRAGGLPENVLHGKTGYIVDPESPEQIADHVNLILTDPQRRAEMGVAARRFIQTERELGTTAEGYLELYRRVAGWEGSARREMELVG